MGSVEEGIEKAREIAGDRDVTILSPNVIQQALDLGVVDEVCVSIAPVLYGEGIPYFAKLDRGHVLLRRSERGAGHGCPAPPLPGSAVTRSG